MNRRDFLKTLGVVVAVAMAPKVPALGPSNEVIEAPVGTLLNTAAREAPKGWLFCEGQALSVREYPALFAVLGDMYGTNEGWDGKSETFKLPDFRGRSAREAVTTLKKKDEPFTVLVRQIIKA